MLNTAYLYSRTGRVQKHLQTITPKLVLFVACCVAASRLYAQPVPFDDRRFWMPDGPVNAILPVGNTVYLAGDFSYIGPRTGPAALFDPATGNLLASPPRISNTIKAIVPDGSGGWFIGGNFTNIGTVVITNVAHLNADLSVDTHWNARLIGTTVNALGLNSGTLYVGGTFTRVGGQLIAGLVGLILQQRRSPVEPPDFVRDRKRHADHQRAGLYWGTVQQRWQLESPKPGSDLDLERSGQHVGSRSGRGRPGTSNLGHYGLRRGPIPKRERDFRVKTAKSAGRFGCHHGCRHDLES